MIVGGFIKHKPTPQTPQVPNCIICDKKMVSGSGKGGTRKKYCSDKCYRQSRTDARKRKKEYQIANGLKTAADVTKEFNAAKKENEYKVTEPRWEDSY